MCYHFYQLLTQYVKDHKTLPDGISDEKYNVLMNELITWPYVNIYAQGDLVDGIPYRLMTILKPDDPRMNLWTVDRSTLKFLIPNEWAKFCDKSFHQSSTALQCLMPEKMSMKTDYRPSSHPSDKKQDVYASFNLHSKSFYPFYCYYSVLDQSEIEADAKIKK